VGMPIISVLKKTNRETSSLRITIQDCLVA
jgi:hypothetical protein